ncbi:MAG: hypothetical protein ACJA0N_001562 [Pseudohongiellaceae bacterium]|jgi:hypothetical protein
MVLLTGVVSAATITRGFVGYLNVFVEISDLSAITLVLIGLCAMACWGVSQSVTAARGRGFVISLSVGGGCFINAT